MELTPAVVSFIQVAGTVSAFIVLAFVLGIFFALVAQEFLGSFRLRKR